jgi:alcohol dehydrogenase
MRALRLVAEQQLDLCEVSDPPDPHEDDVTVSIRALALNHIDVWGFRGMAFTNRTLPLTVGAEAVGEIIALGANVSHLSIGQRVALYGAQTCGQCVHCRSGRDNLCASVDGIKGFHTDGFACERVNIPARLAIPVPDNVTTVHAACAPITFSTVEHMLFDNAQLRRDETILIHAGGSGIGSTAITLAKATGSTVITTVGSDWKKKKAEALGADHVINYREDRFEHIVRKLTGKRGVDVVFEHTGADTWNGSLLSLRRGGRLVTCGSTSGPSSPMNLMQLFQQQYRIYGSFGASIRNVGDGLQKMAIGLTPTIDSEMPLSDFNKAIEKLRSRHVFGKIIIHVAT